jgi:hypothetical protein
MLPDFILMTALLGGSVYLLSPNLFSPVGDYLRDPLGAFQNVLAHLRDLVLMWAPVAGPVLAIAISVAFIARLRWHRRYHQRLVRDARLISVLAPPTVDPSGAVTVWSNLVGLLRPGWLRRFSGQPHLAFELTFTDDGVQIQFWVPGQVPPGMVERAIEAAWPGAHTRTTPAKSPIPAAATGRRVEAVGGELRLARTEALPICTEHSVDPIRALLGAPVGLGPHERACVQILARPVAGHRVTKARRAARRMHAGGSPHLIGRLLDLLTPGKMPKSATKTRSPEADRQSSLELAAQDRVVVEKLRANQFETRIRYAISTTVPENAAAGDIQAVREFWVAAGTQSPRPSPLTPSTTTTSGSGFATRSPRWEIADSARATCSQSESWRRSLICRSTRPRPDCSGPARKPCRHRPESPTSANTSSRSGCRTPVTLALSACASRMLGTTCTSWAPPAPASRS